MSREIPLTRGFVALVDDQDFDWLSQWKWCAKPWTPTLCYAVRRDSDGRAVAMHRAILTPAQGVQVDHKDGDGLNNQRFNLRLCSQRENLYGRSIRSDNTLGFKGVARVGQRFRAKVVKDGHTYWFGTYSDIESAARAYDAGAKQLFGEFARLNFPEVVA